MYSTYSHCKLCPLSHCAWSRDGVCVLRFGDWCPNRGQRESARRAQQLQELIRQYIE